MKYLGIDFGLRRIGLATSEGEIASPLKIVEVKGFKDAVGKILEIVEIESIDRIVIGLPEGKMGQAVLGFIKALKKTGLDVITADETLSSKKALQQMVDLSISKKERRANDSFAAGIILQEWLDQQ